MCLSMKCICDRSYCKQYIYKQGRYKTILEFIILILYVVVTLASISLLYLLFQPAQACCGFINVENGNCNIEFYNANYIDISQIDDISICIDKKKSLLCDSFIRNNTAITLNECISESGYHVPDICSLSNLNTSHPREFSSDFYTWTSVYILVIIMLISKCIYIVMQYFGCLKESCQSCRYHPKYIYGIIFIDICLTFAHLTGVWSGLDTGTYFINDSMLDDNIEDFCTTPDIVWKSSFKYLPWFQDVYQYGCLCVFVAITVLNLCMACNNCGERKLQKDELVKMVKGKNLIIEYPKNHERSIEMTDMQILSTCTKSNNDIINNCAYLHRLVHVIKKYELLRVMDKSDIDNDSKDNFVKLCTKDYSNGNLLDDVYHLQQIHNKQYKQIIEEISLSIFCESLKCTAISRHFTPRNSVISSEMKHEEQEESDGIYDLYANIMDNLHVMFFHSTYEESFNRFKSNDNKYNISQNYDLTDGQMVNDNDAHENVATWIDSIFDNLTNAYNVSHAAINQLNDIIINEHYDSESLMEDLKDIEINQSNIRNEMKDDEVISSMTQTMDTTQGMCMYPILPSISQQTSYVNN